MQGFRETIRGDARSPIRVVLGVGVADCHIQQRGGLAMSYAWGGGAGPGSGGGLPPLHAAVGIVRVVDGAPESAPGGGATELVAEAEPVSLELRRLAAELAPMVDVWQRLLTEHIPDPAGRCRTCTKGGTGLPSTRWPCSIHGIADLARRCYNAKSA